MWTNTMSAINLAILIWGRSYAKTNLKKHLWIVGFAMISDIVLVLYLALARKALTKINAEMSHLLMVHVALALIVVILYGAITLTGLRLKKGQEEFRPRMKLLDKCVLIFRSLLLFTSLLMVTISD